MPVIDELTVGGRTAVLVGDRVLLLSVEASACLTSLAHDAWVEVPADEPHVGLVGAGLLEVADA